MLQEIQYKQFEIKYLEELLVIENECFTIPWTRSMFLNDFKNEQARYFMAVFKERVVGYVGVWLVLDEVQMMNIAVKPHFRRRGIGKGLIQKIIDLATQNHFLQITLEVRRGNEQAIRMYQNLGFLKVGYRQKYYQDNGEDALLFRKTLR